MGEKDWMCFPGRKHPLHPSNECGVVGDPDPSTYSEAALRGLFVFARPPPRVWTTREWGAAVVAGLADMQYDAHGGNGQRVVTPRGHRLLAKAQAVADGLSGLDAEHLAWVVRYMPALDDMVHVGGPFVGLTEVVTEMSSPDGGPRWHLRATPWGRLVSALYERGRDG